MQDVRRFHFNFFSTKNKLLQDAFILKYTRVGKPQRQRSRKGGAKKSVHIKYFIPSYRTTSGTNLKQVCQKMFMSILCVSKTKIQRICKNHFTTGLPPTDKRGGDTRSTKFTAKKKAVKQFIESLVPLESHYCRDKSTRQYLSSNLTTKKLWRMYNNIDDPLLRVKYDYFRNIFVKDYNIGFGTPSTDACSTCIQLKERIKTCTNQQEKQDLITEQRVHKLKARAFYDILKQENEGEITMSFDCQKNMVLPKIPDQSAYYSRQLYIYNFTICVGSSKTQQHCNNTFIYTWTEDLRSKGSNEIVSAVHNRLKNCDLTDIHTVKLMADGAGGQNKNTAMVGMAMKWLTTEAPDHVKKVLIVYPVAGHSFIPPDRIFGRIERVVKKIDTIISPEEYLDIYSTMGTVLKLGTDFVVQNWKSASTAILKPTTKWHFRFNYSKRFIITKSRKGDALIQGEPNYRVEYGNPKTVSRPKVTARDITPADLPVGVNVKPAKLKDVNSLLTKHFGNEWMNRPDLQWYKEVIQRQAQPENHEEPDEMEQGNEPEPEAI